MAKEALGIEDEGILTELLEDMPETEELDELLPDSTAQQIEAAKEMEDLPEVVIQEQMTREELEKDYVSIDIKI